MFEKPSHNDTGATAVAENRNPDRAPWDQIHVHAELFGGETKSKFLAK
jgi:hypothetical protein